MKILRDIQVPELPEEQILRETAWGDLIYGLVLAALAAGFGWLPFSPWSHEAPAWICWLLVAVFGGLSLLCFNGFRGSRDPQGWKLRWTADGLYVRYRSFRNRRFPATTPSVVYLPRREIAAIRPYSTVMVTVAREGDRANWRRSGLEIELDGVNPKPLAKALSDESRQLGPRGSRCTHQPVTLTKDGVLQVEVRRRAPLLEALAQHFRVTWELPLDWRDPRNMSPAEQEDHILDLLLAGDRMGAIRMVRELNDCSLAEARAFVNSLHRR